MRQVKHSYHLQHLSFLRAKTFKILSSSLLKYTEHYYHLPSLYCAAAPQSLFLLIVTYFPLIKLTISLSSSYSPQSLVTTILLSTSRRSSFHIPQTSKIMKYLSFCVWLILLTTMISAYIYIVTNLRILFFLWLHSVPLLIDQFHCCFHFFAIVTSASIIMGVQISEN